VSIGILCHPLCQSLWPFWSCQTQTSTKINTQPVSDSKKSSDEDKGGHPAPHTPALSSKTALQCKHSASETPLHGSASNKHNCSHESISLATPALKPQSTAAKPASKPPPTPSATRPMSAQMQGAIALEQLSAKIADSQRDNHLLFERLASTCPHTTPPPQPASDTSI
jgi:hypothetical protein